MAIGAAIVTATLGTASAVGKYNAAKSSARAMKRQAEQEMENRKQEILKLAATQKVGYIQAGVELEGTPQAVIQDTYQTGIEDVNAIRSNYKQAIKNTLTQARTSLLADIVSVGNNTAKTYMSFGGGEGGSSGLGTLFSSGVENMAGQSSGWNPSTSAPVTKPV